MKFQHLYKRELLSFVATPIAWVVGFVFLLVPAFMFLVTDGFIASGQASLRGYFDWIPLMFPYCPGIDHEELGGRAGQRILRSPPDLTLKTLGICIR
jgi:hypothetical protein